MSIAVSADQKTFYLSGGNTSYVLHIDDDGRLVNLHWGSRVADGSLSYCPSDYYGGASFDKEISRIPLDIPCCGTGWYGTPAVGVRNAHGDDVTDLLFQFLPDLSSIRSLVNNMVSNLQSQSTGLLASVAAITTLWSASAGTTAVQAGLQKIAQVPKKGVRDKLVSLLFTLLYVILIPALLILQVMQESILNLLTTVTAQIGIEDVVEKVASIMKVSNVVAVIGAIVILALTYACLPGKKRALKDQIPGTIFMGVLFVLFTKLFGFFIPRFYHSSGIYGSLASLFLALLWLRFAIMILFYGGALNEALIAQKEKQKE